MGNSPSEPNTRDTEPATPGFTGPIGYLVFILPSQADIGPAMQSLLQQVDSGSVELLDLEVLGLDPNGKAQCLPVSVLHHQDGIDLSDFEGADSALLDDDDLQKLAAELSADELALVVVYVDRSLAQFAANIEQVGGRELWIGGASLADLDPTFSDSEGDQR